jgi:hypothetical protein
MVQKGCSASDDGDDYKLHSMEGEKRMTLNRKMSSGNSNKLLETMPSVYKIHNFDIQCNNLSKMDNGCIRTKHVERKMAVVFKTEMYAYRKEKQKNN